MKAWVHCFKITESGIEYTIRKEGRGIARRRPAPRALDMSSIIFEMVKPCTMELSLPPLLPPSIEVSVVLVNELVDDPGDDGNGDQDNNDDLPEVEGVVGV